MYSRRVKIIFALFALILVVFFILLNAKSNEIDNSVYTRSYNYRNFGSVTEIDGIAYYGIYDGIYRVNDNVKIFDGIANDICSSDNWIYFHNYDESSIYKISKDGKIAKEIIKMKYIRRPYVERDSLYFIATEGNNETSAYKADLEGNIQSKILLESINNLLFINNKVYYEYGNKIIIVDFGKKEKKKLNNLNVMEFLICEDVIYYTDPKDNGSIYKAKIDGTDQILICGVYASDIILYKDWIYFSNNLHNQKLYKVNVNSGEMIQLSDDRVEDISIAGDELYYLNISDYKMYKCRLDGSGKIKLE